MDESVIKEKVHKLLVEVFGDAIKDEKVTSMEQIKWLSDYTMDVINKTLAIVNEMIIKK